MKRLLPALLATLAALIASGTASACEKHLQGHQGSSDSTQEGINQ